jgi:type 1 glutamine amidotransferase
LKSADGEGFSVEVANTLDAYTDEAKLKSLNLIVPVWTMSKISGEQLNRCWRR